MRSFSKGVVVPLVIIVIVAIAIGAVVYYSKTNPSLPVVAITDNPYSEVEMADWKTYKDETYGFEFKYPSDWNIIKNDPYGWVVRKYPDYGFYLGVSKHGYPQGLESALTPYRKLSSIDNHKAFVGGTEEYVEGPTPKQDAVYAVVETAPYSPSSHVISLSMDSNNHTKEMRRIFSGILSSFKFTR